jgi:pimeloyl-ACP methyl ester carboxylesterase
MRPFVKIFTLLVVVALEGCFSKPPTRTARPDLTIPPWEELTIRSERSGQSYNYMFAKGPSPDSPAILLLHGGFFDQRMWMYMSGLNQKFNVYAMEWPNSSPFYTGKTSDYAQVIDDFLEALGLDDLFIAGVSNGVYGAIELVVSKPERRVMALFLFSSVMYGISEEEVQKRTGLAARALSFEPTRLQRIVEWKVSRTDFEPAPGETRQNDIFYTRPYSYYNQLFSAAVDQGAKKQATDQVDCPVLILHGEDDETMPVDAAKLSVTVFSDAEFKEFEDYTHSMVFSHGPDLVPVVFEFIKRRDLL